MSEITLTQFREALLDDPRREDRLRDPRRRRIFVDRNGRIVIGDDVGDGERRQLSEVHPAVFA
jgi:hypothetical protein